ncbi:hypothetical protein FA15DRAFT_707197 [Coprinopsis marcescibilis]|uniref:AA9 family lytic polysaccharide monooxygenase n=1 Tax=Coprinopsis marcescibilis TaxID=230819 RepID=A0A5C3KNM6_COPMA|nr:hypothetical protein FA15DRAFT_707197 [Coprinopsis marcescibilis]
MIPPGLQSEILFQIITGGPFDAKVPDARQSNVEGLKWFKIYHEGFDSAAGLWATQKLIENKGKVSFKVPACIEPGQYLLRAEIIALHVAHYDGAQFFLSCAQLDITGGGNVVPATTAKFPGAYNSTDQSLRRTIVAYMPNPPNVNYPLPGPPVFDCKGPNVPWTPVFKPLLPAYEQCGGINYSGPTECVSGNCIVLNEYYHQCWPN